MAGRKVEVGFDFEGLSSKLMTEFIREFKRSKAANKITDKMVKSIRKDAVNPKTGKKFKQLKSAKHREYLAKNNPTHADYREKKPNLTIGGRFLNSIRPLVKKVAGGIEIEIGPTGLHHRYKNNKGKLIGKKTPKNTEIHERMAELDRDPLYVSGKLEEEIIDQFEDAINKALKKF